MVQVRDDYPIADDGLVDLPCWLDNLLLQHSQPGSESFDREVALRACRFAQQYSVAAETHSWGEEYSSFIVGLDIAAILAEIFLETESFSAAVVYRCVRDGNVSLDQVEQEFGQNVASLVQGVLQMAAVRTRQAVLSEAAVLGDSQDQADNIRRMLVAMIDDARVALLKLAERTCAIRYVKNDSEKRLRVAHEVSEIYAPLAHRLGIGHIKWELEDFSFRYLYPDEYKNIAKLLAERRLDRQQYIDNTIQLLTSTLAEAGIDADVVGRAKHIYSIYKKMQRKGIPFSQVYDVRALRILVPRVADCYAALGVVHSLYRNIPNEFDDYIANPKENGYRSLHTAVIGPEGKVIEVQIRTMDMHQEAEFGVCAHWAYKGADSEDEDASGYEGKISWLRQVLDWHEELGGSNEVAEQLGQDVVQDRIYVFTPDGHVVQLSQGSTVLDFAYHIHTEIGHRCRGARVDGKIAPLTTQLQTGQQVEILTGKDASPSRDWLRVGMGYVNSAKAKAKIRQWFRGQDKESNIKRGSDILAREFERMTLTSLDYKTLAEKLDFEKVDDLFAAVGAGDVSQGRVLNAAEALFENETEQYELLPKKQQRSSVGHKGDFVIEGVGNLLTQVASCCEPVPGDEIGGFITQGRGVSIHRLDCQNFLHLQDEEPQRIIDVSWARPSDEHYHSVSIAIEAYDRHGLLRDITLLLANHNVNVISVFTESNKQDSTASMKLTVEVGSIEMLSRVLQKLSQLPNVFSAMRVSDGK